MTYRYRLTPHTSLLLVKAQDGAIHYHYRGAANIGPPANYGETIDWLSDTQAKQFLDEGLVERIEEEPADTEEVDPGPLQGCLTALEHLGVDMSAGAPTARAALRDAGYRFGNDVVAATVKARKDAVRALSAVS